MAAGLVPWKSRFRLGWWIHLYLHARSQARYADRPEALKQERRRLTKRSLYALIDNLEGTIRKISWKQPSTEWGDYYQTTNYSDRALEQKKEVVTEFLEVADPNTVWDLGANTGEFSRLASQRGIPTVAFDLDPVAVEKNYQRIRKEKERDPLLPLILDLRNPSPAIGWANEERETLFERGPVDMVFALALVHHLALSNNVPLDRIAEFFRRLCTWLIVEYVPKSDSQVQRLLATREDVFDDYTVEGFETAFTPHFEKVRQVPVLDSERTLYLMKVR